MSSILCRWFGIGCPKPPQPTPPPVSTPTPDPLAKVVFHVQDSKAHPIVGASLNATSTFGPWAGVTDGNGDFIANLQPGHYDIVISAKGFKDRALPADLKNPGTITIGLDSALVAPPTRDELLGVKLTFQGLVVDTNQFGRLPWFEAALPWLNAADRQTVYDAKHIAGDTHCIVFLPGGPPLYDEPNQPYSADRFGPLDWTNGNTSIDSRFTNLIREVIEAGFSKVLLFLDGDGADGQPIAMKQLDLLKANSDFATTLYKYCVVIPGWDGCFYGWEPVTKIVDWALKFRSLFPDGYCGLEYGTGHIPIGEGGEDYKPRTGDPHLNPGRMTDFDLILGEFDDNLHQDSCWQILNRMEPDYIRPADQPSGDDPSRVFYLGVPSPRGPFYHCAFEYGEYEAVRCGSNFDGMVTHVNANRAYLKSMGVRFTG